MTAPERIWLGKWWSVAPTKTSGDDVEYIRADLAAVPAQEDQTDEEHPTAIEKMAYTAGYIDGTCGCKHKFTDQIGVAIGDEYGLAALEPQPDPRDEVIARLVGVLDRIGRGPEDAGCFCGACVQVRLARAALSAAKGLLKC